MNIASKMEHSCAACWHGRRKVSHHINAIGPRYQNHEVETMLMARKCNAAVNDRCQRCVNYLLKRGIVNAACIEYAAPLYNTGTTKYLSEYVGVD